MKTWFEDWERENKISDSLYYKEKILEGEPISNIYTSKPKKHVSQLIFAKRIIKQTYLINIIVALFGVDTIHFLYITTICQIQIIDPHS